MATPEGTIRLTASIAGMARLQGKLHGFSPLLAPAMRRMFGRIGLAVEGQAKPLTPVVTGHLRRSITHHVDTATFPTYVKIGSNVVYAPFIEFGERHDHRVKGGKVYRAAGPAAMLRRGLAAARPAIGAAIQRAIVEIEALWRA